nr:probable kinetochore protein NUF2 [Ipomoea trifida]
MSTYGYPILPRSEIVVLLSEFGVDSPVSEQDLLQPTPELVEKLYTYLLNLLDILQDDNGQADFAALEQLENPDLHVSSVRIMNLLHKIRGVVAAVEFPDRFTLWDLLRPDPERTKSFLSALLNFCLYKNSKMNDLESVAGQLGDIVMQKEALEEKIYQLNAEIAQCNESREKEMPFVRDVDAKVKELRQAISGLNNHQMSLKSEIKKMKEKAQEMDEKISNVEFALVRSAQENAHLRSKIVQSPDKLQRALEEKKSHQVEAKNAERAVMQSFQDKNAILEIYTKAQKKMSKHLDQMQAIQEQVNSVKSIEKEVKVLKAKLSDEEVLDKSLEAKLVERQGKADQLDEMRKQVEKECALSREEAAKELNNVKTEVESTRCGLELRQRQVEAVITEGDAVTAKMNSVRESGTAKCEALRHKLEEVVKEFTKYSDSVSDLLQRYEMGPLVLTGC